MIEQTPSLWIFAVSMVSIVYNGQSALVMWLYGFMGFGTKSLSVWVDWRISVIGVWNGMAGRKDLILQGDWSLRTNRRGGPCCMTFLNWAWIMLSEVTAMDCWVELKLFRLLWLLGHLRCLKDLSKGGSSLGGAARVDGIFQNPWSTAPQKAAHRIQGYPLVQVMVMVVDAVIAAVYWVQQYFFVQGQPDAKEPGAKVNKNLKKGSNKASVSQSFLFCQFEKSGQSRKTFFWRK